MLTVNRKKIKTQEEGICPDQMISHSYVSVFTEQFCDKAPKRRSLLSNHARLTLVKAVTKVLSFEFMFCQKVINSLYFTSHDINHRTENVKNEACFFCSGLETGACLVRH